MAVPARTSVVFRRAVPLPAPWGAGLPGRAAQSAGRLGWRHFPGLSTLIWQSQMFLQGRLVGMFALFYMGALVVVILCVTIPQRSGLKQQARYLIEASSVRRTGMAWHLLFRPALTEVTRRHSAGRWADWRVHGGPTSVPGAAEGMWLGHRPD